MCTDCQLPTATGNAFADRMIEALNGAALCLMSAIGHRTGLLDKMASMAPASSMAIAEASGLDERYVREWLGAMVTARVVDHDPASGLYHLPAAHAAFLTRTGEANLAATHQYVSVLGGVEDDIVRCFQKGGGVPYGRYARFHEVMAEESGQTVLPALEPHILPLVPGLIQRLEQGIRVADLGCGRGHALVQLATRFPNSRFTGMDLSSDAIRHGRAAAAAAGLANLDLVVRDLSDFDRTAAPGAFDLVLTFDAIHDQPDPAVLLRGIRRSLAADGVYLAQDIKGSSHVQNNLDHPIGTFLYTISCMHCMTVSLAQGGVGLGAMWGRELATRMLAEAGFGAVDVRALEHDIVNDYYVCRP